MARTDRAAYLDASAVIKLMIAEPESPAVGSFMYDRRAVSSELVLTEGPRAMLRLAGGRGREKSRLLEKMERTLDRLEIVALDRETLILAGSLTDPRLRTLDAIHVATALLIASDVECFVSCDRRQSDAATAAGFQVAQPGR